MKRTVSRPELLDGGSDAAFRDFIHDFLAFAARVNDVRSGFGRALGLSGPAYTVLISIGHLQERHGVGVARIADHLHLSGAFVTIEVSKLVKAGLVRKRVNAADKRRVLLTVTDAGRGLLDELVAVQAPVNDALFGALDAGEFRAFAGMLRRLVPCGDDAVALLDHLTRPATAAGGR